MIYVTGDTHGDLRRFHSWSAQRLRADDVLIICGDFGFLWTNTEAEQKALDWLSHRKYRILFADGKHENYDLLRTYPEVALYGAKAQQIAPNIYHLYRGEIYTIEEKSIFVFGGGESSERQFRIDEKCWWADEIPSHEEMAYALENLQAHRFTVDYIITHEAPPTVNTRVLPGHRDSTHLLDTFFENLMRQTKYRHWYFGSLHCDKQISQRQTALFSAILPTEQKKNGRKFLWLRH